MNEAVIESPLGPIRIGAEGGAIVSLWFEDDAATRPATDPVLKRAVAALEAYFEGVELDPSLPLSLEGTDFQRRVWEELRLVPSGATMAYSELAARVGRPDAVRAVAAAVGRNPVGIVVPCHRILGKDGSLTGFAAGIPRKAWLLGHEARYAPLRKVVTLGA